MLTSETLRKFFDKSLLPYDPSLKKQIRRTEIKRLLRKTAYFMYLPYKWIVALPFFVLITLILSPICLFLTFVAGPKTGSRYIAVLWARMCTIVAPVFLKVKGRENIDPKQSYVIVANHQSHFDIFIVYGWLGIDFKWVMKNSLRKAPGIGITCEKMEHVFIDRSNTQSALKSINEAKNKIKDGTSIFFFPEGTRSETTEIKKFKKGAFRMALDLGLPILPVTINGTHGILPKNSLNLLPGKAEMIIHKPIKTSHFSLENISDLVYKTRKTIEKDLKNQPTF